jgi:hypothetical protein
MNQAPIKSKDELKGYFRNGMMPDEDRFADLIDAMVHRDDLARAALAPRPEPKAEAVVPVLPPQPQDPVPARTQEPAPGWSLAAARFGAFRQGAGKPLPPVDSLDPCTVPADGQRRAILTDLAGCHAFEIVASASGRSDGRCHAVTHAVVLLSLQGHASGIRQTCSYAGWDWRRRIRLRWARYYGNFELTIGTGVDFGVDDDARAALIRYHVTRLW